MGVLLKNHVLELKKAVFEKQKRYARERAIEKSWIIPFWWFCSYVCIHKSALMSHFEAKKADIKWRAPFLRRFRNAASQECPFRNGCQNTQNGDLSNTKGSNGQDVQEGGHILLYVHEVVNSWCFPCWRWGQHREAGVWSDCDGDKRFSKVVYEGNGGQLKQDTPSKP